MKYHSYYKAGYIKYIFFHKKELLILNRMPYKNTYLKTEVTKEVIKMFKVSN